MFSLPVSVVFAINKIFLYIMVIYGSAVITVPILLVLSFLVEIVLKRKFDHI